MGDVLTPEALATVGGAGIVTSLIVQFVVKAFLGDRVDAIMPRFGPLIAILIGVALVVIASFALGLIVSGAAVLTAILTGLFAGLSAIGIYEAAKSPTR